MFTRQFIKHTVVVIIIIKYNDENRVTSLDGNIIFMLTRALNDHYSHIGLNKNLNNKTTKHHI